MKYAAVFCLLFIVSLIATTEAQEAGDARRCQFSSHFIRYCGHHRNWFGITATQCRDRCDRDPKCLVGHWHPGRQIWRHESRPVCFTFTTDDHGLIKCPWGNRALIQSHPGARMIRCSKTQNNEIERCYPSSNFKRHCGPELRRVYGESSERCRQICNDLAACHVAHWHPPRQIWRNEVRPVCFLFTRHVKVCPWHGKENLKYHPGAQMIRCKNPRLISFSYNINEIALLSKTPDVLGKIVIANYCEKRYLSRCRDQSKTFSVSKTTQSSKSWSHTAGVQVMVGTEFEAGIPFVGSGKVKAEVTGSYSHTWGKTELERKTWTTNDKCVAGPGIKTTCEFFVIKKRINVPFVMLWSTGEYTHGMYQGVDFLYGGTTAQRTYLTEKK